MKTLSSVLLVCVTLFGLSAHAIQQDCPLKNLRKSGQTLLDQRTNFANVLQQKGTVDSSTSDSSSAVGVGN